MRVAFASQTGTHVDQHYGQAQTFFVWEVGPDEAMVVQLRRPANATRSGRPRGSAERARRCSRGLCHSLHHADRRTRRREAGRSSRSIR